MIFEYTFVKLVEKIGCERLEDIGEWKACPEWRKDRSKAKKFEGLPSIARVRRFMTTAVIGVNLANRTSVFHTTRH